MLRVMTLNLRRDTPDDGPLAWPHRAADVAALVREQAPHVLGTQEGLPHQLDDLDARLPAYARVGGCRRGDGTDEACALYYARDAWEPRAWGDLWLSDTPSVPGSRSWGNRLPRMVTWATLRSRATGHDITFANTHLDHESEAARARSAAFFAERLPGAVLMGDFNEAPGGVVHHALATAGWRDAGAGDARGTFHGYSPVAKHRIDWVLVPATGAAARPVAHTVISRDGPRWPSDHHAVVADITLTAPRSGPTRLGRAAASTARSPSRPPA